VTVDTKSDEFNSLAAEYALRLLEGDDLEAANLKFQNEPDFAQAVRMWESRFFGLTDTVQKAVSGSSTSSTLG